MRLRCEGWRRDGKPCKALTCSYEDEFALGRDTKTPTIVETPCAIARKTRERRDGEA